MGYICLVKSFRYLLKQGALYRSISKISVSNGNMHHPPEL